MAIQYLRSEPRSTASSAFDEITSGTRPKLYDHDFYEWTLERARVLRLLAQWDSNGRLDWTNIAEEIEDLGKRDRREAESRAALIIQHLLKSIYQPERATRSWQVTVRTQRRDLDRVLRDSPSLRRRLADAYDDVWRRARMDAADETELPIETFPETPKFAIEDVLSPDFMPGSSRSPDKLISD